MNQVASTLFGKNDPYRSAGWGFHPGEAFHTKTQYEVSPRNLDAFGLSSPRSFEGVDYIYLAYITSNPMFRGQYMGQGRRLVGEAIDFCLKFPTIEAITMLVTNPIAMGLLNNVATANKMGLYVLNSAKEPVLVKDALTGDLGDDSRMECLRSSMESARSDGKDRFDLGAHFQAVMIKVEA